MLYKLPDVGFLIALVCVFSLFVLSPVHTTRVHGPRSWAMFLTPVNMGHEHSACPHCPCSWAVNMGSVY